jgi:hypothetical protein
VSVPSSFDIISRDQSDFFNQAEEKGLKLDISGINEKPVHKTPGDLALLTLTSASDMLNSPSCYSVRSLYLVVQILCITQSYEPIRADIVNNCRK